MTDTEFDILEYLASQRGKSAATLYSESGGKAFTEISNELTGGKGFHIIKDAGGRTIGAINNSTGEILGNLSGSTTYGTAAETTASGYNLVTTATTTADTAEGTITTELASGANEAATSAAGKAGVTLSGVTMETAIFSGIAALGGVAQGVLWYKKNPEKWEELSEALLPFAYGNSYSDTGFKVKDALKTIIPAAVGADGKTYLSSDFMNTLSQKLLDLQFFSDNVEMPIIDTTKHYNVVNPNGSKGMTIYNTMLSMSHCGIVMSDSAKNVFDNFSNTYFNDNYAIVCSFYDSKQSYEGWSPLNIYAFTKNSLINLVMNEYNGGYKSRNYIKCAFLSTYGIKGSGYSDYTISRAKIDTTTSIYYAGACVNKYDIDRLELYISSGDVISKDVIDGISKGNDTTLPEKDKDLSDTFPDWFKKALQTLNPDSTPNNPTYNYWYPVSIQNQKDTDGETEGANTTASQKDAQTGNNPDSDISPNTMTNAQEKISEAIKELTKILTKQKIDTPTDTPTDTGETPTPIPPIISGSSNGLWAIYNPTESQLQSFGKWLWSSDIIDQIVKMISNPMDAIIGLHTIYVTPPTGGSATIKAGYLDSGVSSKKVSNQYTNIDCGSITVPEKYKNALDYDYTRVSIYLPFIGIVPLNTRDVMGATLHLTYRVDVLTGTCLAQIRVTKQNSNAVLYTFSGNCAVQIPLTSGNYGTLLTGLLSAVGGVVTSVASGGAALPAVAGIGAAALNGHTNVSQSGNLGSNAGALGIRKPYVIITRPTPYNAENYPSFYGIPSQNYVMLGNVSGFTKVREIHVDNINATNEEKSEIESLLKGGVLL